MSYSLSEQQWIDAVSEITRRRRNILDEHNFTIRESVTQENVFLCRPSMSILTSLAADWTDGFFDEGDLPPCGFWIGYIANDDQEKLDYFGGILVAFIAPKFREIVDEAAPTWIDGFACWGTEIEKLCMPQEEADEIKEIVASAFL